MNHWIDNADSYICPICGFETNNPNRYESARCPICGFQDVKDIASNKNEVLSGERYEMLQLFESS